MELGIIVWGNDFGTQDKELQPGLKSDKKQLSLKKTCGHGKHLRRNQVFWTVKAMGDKYTSRLV